MTEGDSLSLGLCVCVCERDSWLLPGQEKVVEFNEGMFGMFFLPSLKYTYNFKVYNTIQDCSIFTIFVASNYATIHIRLK